MPIQARPRMVFSTPPSAQAHAVAVAADRMDDLGHRIVINARRRVNVGTGELRDSIGRRVSTGGRHVSLTVFATARHARYVHDGTRAHAIVPLNAKALRFAMGGRSVFARRVWHPGYGGNPFLTDAIVDELERLTRGR